MQEKMAYVGQLECYEESSDLLKNLMDVEMSSSQIYRVSDTYGEELCKDRSSEIVLDYPKKEDTLYVEIDGSMVLTREEGWKEVKLARLFLDSDCVKKPNGESGMILKSHYLAHLGGKDTFIEEVESAIETYRIAKPKIVFVSDGATWIKNWIEDSYGNDAVSILDYYHASEYLHEFAEKGIKEEDKQDWLSQQKKLLLEGGVKQVIQTIEQVEVKKEIKQRILCYYESQQQRMDYKTYKTLGVGIIGSGAIESAHKTVVQKRLKLSGQRWSKKGARNMLKLRTTKMNNNWNKIIQLVQTEFKKTA